MMSPVPLAQPIWLVVLLMFLSVPLSAEYKLQLSGKHPGEHIAYSELLNTFGASRDGITFSLLNLPNKSDVRRSFPLAAADSDAIIGTVGADYREMSLDGALLPLNRTWRLGGFDQTLHPQVKDAVTVKGKQYSIPIALHPWGIFYRKKMFDQLGLSEPRSWSEFLIHCELLKSNGITPVVIGLKEPEALTTWFSFINIRINGAAFHRRLLEGKVNFSDDKVVLVFEKWQLLLNRGYVKLEAGQFDWKGSLAALYQNEAAMVMTGRVDHNQLSNQIYKDFGYFPFPSFASASVYDEIVDIDTAGVSLGTTDKLASFDLVAFLGAKESQFELSRALGVIPAYKSVKELKLGKAATIMQNRIKRARQVLPTLSAAVSSEFASEVHRTLKAFVEKPVIEGAIKALESARKAHFGK